MLAREIRVLNEAKTPPFQIAEDAPVSEDVRLRYRYLDLRRPRLQQNIGLRHRVTLAIRKYFDAHGFWEIETPILTKSTPEGARDYLVPSRVHPGEFYALPQSPQIFKQILMMAGHGPLLPDRALLPRRGPARRPPARVHADRRRDVVRAPGHRSSASIEPLMQRLFQRDRPRGADAVPPHAVCGGDCALRLGQARPAVRRWRSTISRSAFRDSEFRVFKQIVADGGVVRGFAVPGGNRYSRSQLDVLVDQAKQIGLYRPRSGCVPASRRVSSVKALGEATLRPALERRPRRARRSAADGGRARPTRRRSCSGSCGWRLRRRRTCSNPSLRVPLGHRFPAARMARRGRALVLDAPSVHVADGRGRRHARERSGARPRQGVRPRPERHARSAAAASESTTPRCRQRVFPSCSGISDEEAGAGSGSSSTRSSTGRRRTAASRSGSTAWSRCSPAKRRFAR